MERLGIAFNPNVCHTTFYTFIKEGRSVILFVAGQQKYAFMIELASVH